MSAITTSLKKQLRHTEDLIKNFERMCDQFPNSAEYKRTLMELQGDRVAIIDKMLLQAKQNKGEK
jgi:hypothetical protein